MFSAKREHACIEDPRTTYLVEEFAVRILSKQRLPHSGSGRVLKKFQSSLKSVVNINLSIATYNNHAAGPGFLVSINLSRIQEYKDQEAERTGLQQGAATRQLYP